MTDRDSKDRLVELFSPFADGTFNSSGTIIDGTKVDDVVDHLIANGVIVPPCKVGAPLFFLNDEDMHGGSVIESTEWIFVYDTDGLIINTEVACFEYSYDYTFGKTVFLTKEEAEEKLKELNKDA